MPGRSSWAARRPRCAGGSAPVPASLGSRSSPSSTAATASGTFSANVVRQPPSPISRPPSSGPITAMVWLATARAVSTPPGLSCPVRLASLRSSAIAAGIPGAGAEPEQDPRGDQHPEVRRQGADDAGDPDQARADQEEPARPEDVDEPAHDRLPESGGQVEGRDEPRGLRGRRAQRVADGDERDGDDRRVDRVEDRAQHHRRQQPPVEARRRRPVPPCRSQVSHG